MKKYGRRYPIRRINRKRAGTKSIRRTYRPSYKTTRSIVKSVLYQNLETKRFTQTFSNLQFAANNLVTGTDGHTLSFISMPTVGVNQNQRIGNKIKVTGLIFNAQYQSAPAGGPNAPLTGRIYLIQHKDGGNTFTIGNFLDNDPNKSSITYNSLRNPDFFTDFIVHRSIRIRLNNDMYATNNDSKSIQMRWKGNIPITINGTTPTDNSLFLLFVSDTGFLSAGGGNTQNNFLLNGQSQIYYKDA